MTRQASKLVASLMQLSPKLKAASHDHPLTNRCRSRGERAMNAYTKPIQAMHRRLTGRDTDTAKIFVCSTLVSGGFARYTVLIDGQYYVVNKYMLADLRAGYSPEELGLEPEETGEDVDV